MPFTVSHIAAVLPARRVTVLPLAGLAVGAMSPDLEYVFQTGTTRTISHSPAGILLLDLPLALLALAVAGLAAPGLASLVPRRWPTVAERLEGWRPPWSTPSEAFWLIVAIVIGAANHIVVDEFTHATGAGVGLVPVLDRRITFAAHTLPLYRWLQYGLSVVGLALVALAIYRWFRSVEPVGQHGRHRFDPRHGTIEIEVNKLLAVLGLGTVTMVMAGLNALDRLASPGLNKATAVVLLLGAWRTGALLLVGMGTAARGVQLLTAQRGS